ncbi:hypothetical protein AB0M95_02520 [Sphaerisporangium sp. NPDC051017]|uniref:hypothetical protein n=1 Tax=Sphaerisporangium sp. NPDC051017 TaxID=3154636 RepID=UPI0034457C30
MNTPPDPRTSRHAGGASRSPSNARDPTGVRPGPTPDPDIRGCGDGEIVPAGHRTGTPAVLGTDLEVPVKGGEHAVTLCYGRWA